MAGALASDVRILSLEESAKRRRPGERSGPPTGRLAHGLWGPPWSGRPALRARRRGGDERRRVARRRGRRHGDRSRGHVVPEVPASCAPSSRSAVRAEDRAAVTLGEERQVYGRSGTRRDNWLRPGRAARAAPAARTRSTALAVGAARLDAAHARCCCLAVARSVRVDDWEAALRGFSDAIALEPIGARDDDARPRRGGAGLRARVRARRRHGRGRGAARAGRGRRGDGVILARRGADGRGGRRAHARGQARVAHRRRARAAGSRHRKAARAHARAARGPSAAAERARGSRARASRAGRARDPRGADVPRSRCAGRGARDSSTPSP